MRQHANRIVGKGGYGGEEFLSVNGVDIVLAQQYAKTMNLAISDQRHTLVSLPTEISNGHVIENIASAGAITA